MTLEGLDKAAVGLPITRRGISFMPVYLPANQLPNINTGPESGIEIGEARNAAVPKLVARNSTTTPILVVEGEHFVGGKQNRMVNATVLVDAGTEIEIPVTCLERGRWGRPRKYAPSASHAPRNVRRRTADGVHRSMGRSGSRRSDQKAVWAEVDNALARHEVKSPTAAAEALHQAYRSDRSWTRTITELAELGPLPGQVGLAISHGSWIAAIELFGTPDLLSSHWKALIRAYLLERPKPDGHPSPTRVLLALRRFGWARHHEANGVGLGTEYRVSNRRMSGQALTLEGNLCHASIFCR